jgi:hypothetical protein
MAHRKLPKISSKACFFQQTVPKKKYTTKIVQNNKCIATPTYHRLLAASALNNS